MRVAAGSACAARPIAQMFCRVDIALEPSSSPAKRRGIKVKSALTAAGAPRF